MVTPSAVVCNESWESHLKLGDRCKSSQFVALYLFFLNSSAVNVLPNPSSLETNAESMYPSLSDLGRSGRWPFGPIHVFDPRRYWAKTLLSCPMIMTGFAFNNTLMLIVGSLIGTGACRSSCCCCLLLCCEMIPIIDVEVHAVSASNAVVKVILKSHVNIFDVDSVLLWYLQPSATIRFVFCEVCFAECCTICNNILTFMSVDIEALLPGVIVEFKQVHPLPSSC